MSGSPFSKGNMNIFSPNNPLGQSTSSFTQPKKVYFLDIRTPQLILPISFRVIPANQLLSEQAHRALFLLAICSEVNHQGLIKARTTTPSLATLTKRKVIHPLTKQVQVVIQVVTFLIKAKNQAVLLFHLLFKALLLKIQESSNRPTLSPAIPESILATCFLKSKVKDQLKGRIFQLIMHKIRESLGNSHLILLLFSLNSKIKSFWDKICNSSNNRLRPSSLLLFNSNSSFLLFSLNNFLLSSNLNSHRQDISSKLLNFL